MARRRRRTRHRRGAVATAKALAVFGIFVLPWLSARSNHDLTAASQNGVDARPSAKLPDVVEMRCLPESIDVVGSARPQPDGMHLRISNERGITTEAWVDAQDGSWSSGRFSVEPGTHEVIVSPPPGPLNVGCDAGLEDAAREVDLVDVDHVHQDNSLDCKDEHQKPDDTPIEAPSKSPSLASVARTTLGDRIWQGDRIAPLNGYRVTQFGTPMADPAVRVVRDGETIAIVYITGETPDDLAGVDNPTQQGPWTSIRRIEYCPEFLQPDPNAEADSGS